MHWELASLPGRAGPRPRYGQAAIAERRRASAGSQFQAASSVAVGMIVLMGCRARMAARMWIATRDLGIRGIERYHEGPLG